jgi:hypothetical protein
MHSCVPTCIYIYIYTYIHTHTKIPCHLMWCDVRWLYLYSTAVDRRVEDVEKRLLREQRAEPLMVLQVV